MTTIPSFRDRGLLTSSLSPQLISTHALLDPLSGEERTRIFGGDALAQLNSLSRERNSEMLLGGLTALAAQLEARGREEGALRIYSFVREESSRFGLDAAGARAATRSQALLGEGSSGLRTEIFLRRLTREVLEPTSLAAMGVAGGVYRLTRLATLSRLSASALPGFWTAGTGARMLSSVAAYAVEAPVFALTAHSARAVLGGREGWAHFDRELAASFFMLGGLRLAGAASLGLHRQILGRAETAGFLANGSFGRRLSETLFHQGGMFAGIVAGHGLEQAAGLAPHRPAGSLLADSLGTLIQFNLAGQVVGRAFGAGFRSWERRLDAQSETLIASRPRFPGSWNLPGAGNFGLTEALAVPGGRLSGPPPAENAETSARPFTSMMSIEGEGGSSGGYDKSGIELLRTLRNMKFPEDSPEAIHDAVRNWIEAQPHPIVVAVSESKLKLPRFVMVNNRFARTFRWNDAELAGAEIATVFDPKRSNFTVSRIFSNFAGIMMSFASGRPVEFDPTPMPIRLGTARPEGMADLPADLQFADVVGAGFYRKIGDKNYAFGIFTEVPAEFLKTRSGGGATFPPPPLAGSPLPTGLGDGTGVRPRPPRRAASTAQLPAVGTNGGGVSAGEPPAEGGELRKRFLTAVVGARTKLTTREDVTLVIPGTTTFDAMEEALPFMLEELWNSHVNAEMPLGRKVIVRFQSELGTKEWTFSRGIISFRKVDKP